MVAVPQGFTLPASLAGANPPASAVGDAARVAFVAVTSSPLKQSKVAD